MAGGEDAFMPFDEVIRGRAKARGEAGRSGRAPEQWIVEGRGDGRET
jgi:hypothetical protein